MEQVHCTDVVTALVSNFACDKIPTRNDIVTLVIEYHEKLGL